MPDPVPILAAQIGPDVDVTASPIDADGWQWVRIFPWGTTTFRDGRGPYNLDEASAATVLTKFESGRKLLVDYEHRSEPSRSQNGTPEDSKASGWGYALAIVSPDGKGLDDKAAADGLTADIVGDDPGAWARIQWTPSAKQGIDDKEWSYVSPVFWADDDGHLLGFKSVGLTNVPAITELDALAATAGGREGDMGDKPTGANVVPAGGAGGEDESWRPIATSLGIKATTRSEFDAQLASMKTRADEAAAAKAKADELEAEKASREAKDAATEAVTAAVQAGKIDDEPDTIAAYVKMATANMDSFEAIMAATKSGSRSKELPPQGKHGRDVAGGAQAASTTQDTDDGPVTAINLPSDMNVDEAKLQAACAVLANAKADMKSPAGRNKIRRVYQARLTGTGGVS